MAKTIFAEKIFTGNGVLNDHLITCADGVITAIEPSVNRNAGHKAEYLSAGFFDTHINGGSEHYLTRSPDIKTVEDIAWSSAALGTAYTLPTLVTSPVENILQGIEAVNNYRKKNPGSGVMGMHLEGPFINPVKRGAHLTRFILQPTYETLSKIVEHGKGVIKLMTIAPEVFDDQLTEVLLRSGITISAGHSNATYEEAQTVFKKGVQMVTHLYNAMSAFTHRAPGLTGAAFNNDNVYAPIILDGFHCDFSAAGIAYKIKKDKLFLISDALFTGNKIRHFKWDDFDVRLQDGKYINSEGNLSGATISMGDAVRNAVKELDIGLQEAVEMATVRPASAVGLEKQIGRIKIGYPAVFTCFDSSLNKFEVLRP